MILVTTGEYIRYHILKCFNNMFCDFQKTQYFSYLYSYNNKSQNNIHKTMEE